MFASAHKQDILTYMWKYKQFPRFDFTMLTVPSFITTQMFRLTLQRSSLMSKDVHLEKEVNFQVETDHLLLWLLDRDDDILASRQAYETKHFSMAHIMKIQTRYLFFFFMNWSYSRCKGLFLFSKAFCSPLSLLFTGYWGIFPWSKAPGEWDSTPVSIQCPD